MPTSITVFVNMVLSKIYSVDFFAGVSCNSNTCEQLVSSLQKTIEGLSGKCFIDNGYCNNFSYFSLWNCFVLEKLLAREVVWERRHMRLEEKVNALTSMTEMGNKMLVKITNTGEVPSFIEKFPITSIEEFEEMEEQLSNYSMYKALVSLTM